MKHQLCIYIYIMLIINDVLQNCFWYKFIRTITVQKDVFNKLTLNLELYIYIYIFLNYLIRFTLEKGVIILSEYMQEGLRKPKVSTVTQIFHKGCKAKHIKVKKRKTQLWKPINLSVKIIKFHNKKSKDQGYQIVWFQLTTHWPWQCYLPWNNMSIISVDLETRDQRITNISSYQKEKANCYTNILHKI